ncbi:MAG: AI-2E family transporter [Verrucomicrobium sp.]|nr:AI-2E family transporter [Verrucomicrobium sp.]
MTSPSDSRSKVQRQALDLLSRIFIAAAAVGAAWILGHFLNVLQDVLIPLAIAGILAYLLHPVVNLVQRVIRPRFWAVAALFVLIAGLLTAAGFFLGPLLYNETQHLVTVAPQLLSRLWDQLYHFLTQNSGPLGNMGEALKSHLDAAASKLAGGMGTIFHTVGLALGLVFIPFFLFYFLVCQPRIEKGWRNYLPIKDPRLKQEAVVIIEQTNKYLVSFFRGQIVVAVTDGLLLAIGLTIVRLDYGLALGAAAMVLTVIPYFGIITVGLAAGLVSFYQQGGGAQQVLLTLAVFAIVQTLENTVISPQVMKQRIGLHPMTIIVSILVWSNLLGGFLGALLAIPLTATLKVLLTRYGLIHPGDATTVDRA